MKRFLGCCFLTCLTLSGLAQNYVSQVWNPDNGDGTYTNPVINADYSDPDVCVGASGEDYYLTASSFQCIPGLPVLHSKDLVNWEIINYAIKGGLEPRDAFTFPSHGNGVWAPSIRYHNGEYFIFWGDPDYGMMMVKTRDPAGEWSKPKCIIPGKGIFICSTASSTGITPVIRKNADWRIVLVRLPRPISWAIFVALMV